MMLASGVESRRPCPRQVFSGVRRRVPPVYAKKGFLTALATAVWLKLMHRRSFETALGQVTLTGLGRAFAGPEPLVVVLRGIFATEHQLSGLPAHLPEARILYGETHGNHAPQMPTPSVGAFCAAYSEAIAQLPGSKVICGVSLGGVVALGLECPGLSGVLALDPPMRSEDSPELATALAKRAVGADKDLIWNIFGVSSAGAEPRDYFPVLHRLRQKAIIMAGDHRCPEDLPGAISDESLERLSRHPMITAERISGVGHDVTRGASDRVVSHLRDLIRGAAASRSSFA